MTKELKLQISDFKKQYSNYKTYMSETDWTKYPDLEESYKTESDIVDNIVRDLKRFTTENKSSLHYKGVQEFFKFCNSILKLHTDRIDRYLKENDWQTRFKKEREEITQRMRVLEDEGIDELNRELHNYLVISLQQMEEEKRREIKFQNILFTQKTKVRVDSVGLNVDSENNSSSPHLFYSDKKASLIMRRYLTGKDSHLTEKTEALNINWESPNPSTSKELYINMKPKDIPPYDEKKHFFEQPLSTIQFWEEENKKIREGINLGGYHISPYLYFSMNYGNIPQGSGQNKFIAPAKFRDNDYFIDQCFQEAREKDYEGLLLYGSRRVSKSVNEAIYVAHGMLTIEECSGALNGFSEADLGHVRTYLNTIFTNLPPALKPNINVNSEKEFVIGIKHTAQDNYNMGKLSIVNLDGGTKKTSSQKTAGFTPDVVVFDEISKGLILDPWLALRAALSGGEGGKRRTVALLAATAGEQEMSKHAEKMLKNTEAYGILPMNWDLLDKITDPEYITWKHKKFATFIPAQMSMDGRKIDTNFKEFLKSDNEELEKVPFQKTDWKYGKEKFEDKREKAKSDYKAQASEIASFPLDSDDVYLSGDKNAFNAIGMKVHKQWILDKELEGKKVRMTLQHDGSIYEELSNSPIIDKYPFPGGAFDAPVVIHEDIDQEPPFGLYVMGIDDVKHDISDGDSVISCTVYKRGWELSEWADRIVCTYDTRPSRKEEAYKTMYCIMKKYNAIVFPEAEDEGFKDFLERRHRLDAIKHLAEGVNFSRSLELDVSRNRPIGFPATVKNINKLNSRVLAYTQEDTEAGEGIITDGYTRINATMLLEEMINNKKGANADRIRSFGLALIYAEYLDKNNMYISRRRNFNQESDQQQHKRVTLNKGLGRNSWKGLKKGF